MQNEEISKNFISLLEEIRKRPTLYLPRRSIFDLQAFYYGYDYFRLHKSESCDNSHLKEFEDFLDWIREICPVKTNMSWANLLFVYSTDERSAFDKFFELLDNYRQVQAESINILGESQTLSGD
jgi:hypothetical protein